MGLCWQACSTALSHLRRLLIPLLASLLLLLAEQLAAKAQRGSDNRLGREVGEAGQGAAGKHVWGRVLIWPMK